MLTSHKQEMDPLLEAIPPRRLIELAGQPSSRSTAEFIASQVLANKAVNKEYRREVMQVWGHHHRHGRARKPEGVERLSDDHLCWHAQQLTAVPGPPTTDLSVGPVLAEIAARKLSAWPVATARPASEKVEARLRTILHECANAATLDKHGDLVLHGLLKLHISAASLAGIASEPPYEKLNEAHGMAVNDIVNKWLDVPMEQLSDHVKLDEADPHSLTLAGGLIAEIFDHTPSSVAVNSEVLSRKEPCLMAFAGFGDHTTPDLVGCAINQTIVVAPPVRPLASVLLAWAKATPKSLLGAALTDPVSLPPGSLPRKWLT